MVIQGLMWPFQQLCHSDRQSDSHCVGGQHASGGASGLYAAGFHYPCCGERRECQPVVAPSSGAAALAKRSGQVVEIAMGERLDEASNRHQYAVTIEAHLLAGQAVFQDGFLYDAVHQRILALDGSRQGEQQQGKEEFLHACCGLSVQFGFQASQSGFQYHRGETGVSPWWYWSFSTVVLESSHSEIFARLQSSNKCDIKRTGVRRYS